MRLRRLLPLLFLAACDGDPSGPGAVRMDVTLVRAGSPPAWETVFEVHNPTSRSVYLGDLCGHHVRPTVERRTDGTWAEVPSNEVCSLAFLPPVVLAAGDRYEGTLRIPEPGRYRLRLQVGTGSGASSGSATAWKTETSPAFDVPAN
jgi:hypothetical protein